MGSGRAMTAEGISLDSTGGLAGELCCTKHTSAMSRAVTLTYAVEAQ